MDDHSTVEMLRRLERGILDLTSSERWRQFLLAQSIFRHYSYRNVLLITQQCPGASQVAGFRCLAAARAIRLSERTGHLDTRAGRARRAENEIGDDAPIRGFVSVPVFDISQTKGSDLPEVCTKLCSSAGRRSKNALVEAAASLGFRTDFCELDGGVNGECNFHTRMIRIERRNDTAQQVKSLAHELVHAILHEGTDNRARAELEAESAAYIICQHLGIDSGDYSFGYLATWAGDGAQALAAIQTSCEVIDRAVVQVIELIGGHPR